MLSILAGLLYIVAYVPYIRAIVRKEAQPAKASWIIWASLDTITLAGMIAKHALNGLIVGALVGAWTVVVLALKHGKSGWTRLDKFCLGGAVLGLVLWGVSGNPTFGIVTSLTVMFVGSFPTFVSAWKDPGNENRTAWTIFFVSCIVAMLAVPEWTVANTAQPIAFLAIEGVMMFILYAKPRPARLPRTSNT